jgi:hypothetical protein
VAHLLEFDTAFGPVLVEADEALSGYADIGRDGVAAKAAATLDAALDVVRPVTSSLIEKFQQTVRPPTELQVEFGIKLTMSTGAVIASSNAEGHIKVVCKWQSLPSIDEPQD